MICELDTNAGELLTATGVEAGEGIAGDHQTKISLTGLVNGGTRTVGKVAAGDDQGVDGLGAKQRLERGLVEGTPAWLVNHMIVRTKPLHLASKQGGPIEGRCAGGLEAARKIGTVARHAQKAAAVENRLATTGVYIGAIGEVAPHNVHNWSTSIAGGGGQRSEGWQHLEGAGYGVGRGGQNAVVLIIDNDEGAVGIIWADEIHEGHSFACDTVSIAQAPRRMPLSLRGGLRW